MKKLVIVLFILCLGTVSAVAQLPLELAENSTQEQRERAAKRSADLLADRMKLSDEQIQKVYDINLKRLVAEASSETRDEIIEIHKEYGESLQKVLTPKQNRRYGNYFASINITNDIYKEIISFTPEELQQHVKSRIDNLADQLGLSQEQKQNFFALEMERLTNIRSTTSVFDRNFKIYVNKFMEGLEKILTPGQWAMIEKSGNPNQKTSEEITKEKTTEEIAKEKKKTERNLDKTRKDLQKKLDKAARKQQK